MNRWSVSCGLALLILTSSMALKGAIGGSTGTANLPVPPPPPLQANLPVPPPPPVQANLPVPPPPSLL